MPMASFLENPVIFSAARLNEVISQSLFTVKAPWCMESRIASLIDTPPTESGMKRTLATLPLPSPCFVLAGAALWWLAISGFSGGAAGRGAAALLWFCFLEGSALRMRDPGGRIFRVIKERKGLCLHADYPTRALAFAMAMSASSIIYFMRYHCAILMVSPQGKTLTIRHGDLNTLQSVPAWLENVSYAVARSGGNC